MINLIRAELYKEIHKKSFVFILMLIIFVSILSMVIINKNIDVSNNEELVSPKYSEEEFKSVNKYGDYDNYLKNYEDYEQVINMENEVKLRNESSYLQSLLSYSHNFLYLLGVVVIFLAFHSFSYDYQKYSLKYIFISKYERKYVFFSKLITISLLTLFYMIILLLVMCITASLLTGENIFTMKLWINSNGYFRRVPYLVFYLKMAFVYFVPFFFMIVFSMFCSIVFKGNNFGLVLSGIIYFASLLFSQILFNYGFMFVKYTFLPYIDFTYLVDIPLVLYNNLIFDLNFSYGNSIFVLIIYSLIFIDLSLLFLKRDV